MHMERQLQNIATSITTQLCQLAVIYSFAYNHMPNTLSDVEMCTEAEKLTVLKTYYC